MRYSSVILAMGLGLATSISAQAELPRIIGCNDDNCLRALKNAAQRPGAFQDCISFSSAILADNPITKTVTSTTTEVTTTITPPAGGGNKRDFVNFNRRDVTLPGYAPDKCKGDASSRYWSACSCIIRSSSRAGVTTVTIPPVTVTSVTWSIIPATATALAPGGDPFRISFADNDGNDQYLSMKEEESGDPASHDAIFTPDISKAARLKVVTGGNIAEVDSDKIIQCDTGGTPDSFRCAFFDPQQASIPGKAPMKCASTGIAELRCSIPTGDYPIWAIAAAGSRRMKRKIQRRAENDSGFGFLKNAAALSAFTEFDAVGIILNSLEAANPSTTTTITTTSGGPADTTTTSHSETITTDSGSATTTATTAPPSATTESEEPEPTTTVPPASTATSEEPEPTTTVPPAPTTESEEPETTVTVSSSSTTESDESTSTTTAPQSTTTEPEEQPEIAPTVPLRL
ncbi:hypothetical protein TWF506_006929 [Arthrobotrys conoides]|uniref:Uncharacterized protein n=1 Tax=Arthrobotrys conoides TaxID=74498 RepID=A0AAN8S1S2_9PEZI